MINTFQPSPLEGEGGSRRLTDEGAGSASPLSNISRADAAPSSGASRHLLPQGEKEGTNARHILPRGEKAGNAIYGR